VEADTVPESAHSHASEGAIQALARKLANRAVLPGDERFDAARRSWNLALDQRPRAVVLAESIDDIEAAVAAARDGGLRVTVQGRGHGGGGLAPLDDTILVNTTRLGGVTVDATARRARVEAGAKWGDVQAAAAAHGLYGLSGSSPDVGVVGLSLGGGVGWLARRHGLAANSILAADVITADGRRLSIDEHHEPDLFWAIRGGGGSFAIVTALEFAIYPVAEVYAGILFWPMERAREILRAWTAWTGSTPNEVTSVGRLFNFPPLPDIPEPFRGQSFVAVEAAILGSAAEGAALIEPLVALGPTVNTFATMPALGLGMLHMDPIDPAPAVGAGGLLHSFPIEAVDALVKVAGPGSGSPLLSVEVRQFGGALGVAPSNAGALAKLDGDAGFFCVSLAMSPDMAAAAARHEAVVVETLKPWRSRGFMNFTEQPADAAGFFDGPTYARLQRIKAAYDPGNILRANHEIRLP